MSGKEYINPRSLRAKKAFHEALLSLLEEKPFAQITVSNLAKKAGYSRFTFYNHFETKQALLRYIIDEKLDNFFDVNIGWNMFVDNPQEQRERFSKFFKMWENDYELIKLMDANEFDCLLLDRLLEYFTYYFYEEAAPKITLKYETLSSYVIAINAHVFVGTFREWIKRDMEIPPEKMGILLEHYLGPKVKAEMLEKMKDIF
jgi:AcrR family transcriptional regulator